MYIISPIRESRCLTYGVNLQTRHVHSFSHERISVSDIWRLSSYSVCTRTYFYFTNKKSILFWYYSLSHVISVYFCHMIIYLIRSLSPVPLHLVGCICICVGQWNLRHKLKIPGQKLKDLFCVCVFVCVCVCVCVIVCACPEVSSAMVPLTLNLETRWAWVLRLRSTSGERILCTHLQGNWDEFPSQLGHTCYAYMESNHDSLIIHPVKLPLYHLR